MFIKHPDNPIYGGPDTGTLFDATVTRQPGGLLRMDLSWRPEACTAAAFSKDGVRWTPPRPTLYCDPASGWEDLVNRNCVLKIGDTYKMCSFISATGISTPPASAAPAPKTASRAFIAAN